MNRTAILFFLFCIMVIPGLSLNAQSWEHTDDDRKVAFNVDTIEKKGFTLIWINKDKDFSPNLKKELITTYFQNYPKLVKTFNKESRKVVTFVIDPDYKGVAATAGGIVRYSPDWFAKNPNDIDVVTHEIMHIVQAYPNNSGPWWVTEGIADFIRFKYGVANEAGDWKLPEFSTAQKYTDSYRVTARFFHWIEKNVKKNFVKKLDKAMREKTYSEDFWKNETGESIDTLWAEYAENPKI
ncbi:secretory protein [Sphingobacterium shayense]|uniref:basic secretory protein-like protein n=1 Tax=Sphingobacterium shayense TaxID=626343 RepID=UPI0015541EF3|nr:basic secretory protein-like protein [Sphingobacterium shayense]NQD71462.1 secretory protein [Sphingobacterium shayense]